MLLTCTPKYLCWPIQNPQYLFAPLISINFPLSISLRSFFLLEPFRTPNSNLSYACFSFFSVIQMCIAFSVISWLFGIPANKWKLQRSVWLFERDWLFLCYFFLRKLKFLAYLMILVLIKSCTESMSVIFYWLLSLSVLKNGSVNLLLSELFPFSINFNYFINQSHFLTNL